MTIEELKKYKWFVATCKYEGIVGKKHCFTYDVDNLNTNLLSGMILVDDELVKETEEKGVWQDCVFDAICDEKVQIVQQCSKPIILYEEVPEYDEWVNLLLYRYLEQHYYEKKWMTYTSPILQIILAGWFLHNETKTYNSPTLYLVKELDYYARTEQWDKLLSAPLRSDKNAMHACFQNLALAQKGILADKALSLKQVGADGLWIAWNRSTTASTLLSDVYYAMGSEAIAQRMAFEGMISSEWTVNPRLLTRLVKTNLIYGNHAVAGKYISMLEDTHAYKEQAVALKRFLNNDEAIDKDPELGFKRRCIAKTDGLAQIEGVPYDLLQIIASNPECKTAFEYLGIFCLMNKDIIPFNQLIETYHNAKGLSPMPVSFQEAIILAHEGDTAAWTRLGVTPQVAERFRTFKQTVLQNRGSAALPNKLHTGFGNTYWYYYMFKK